MQSAGVDLAGENGIIHIIGTVKANHKYVAHAGSIERSLSAERHGVVTADDTLDIRICLQEAFHDVEGFGLAPVGGLLCNHFHAGEGIEDIVVTL